MQNDEPSAPSETPEPPATAPEPDNQSPAPRSHRKRIAIIIAAVIVIVAAICFGWWLGHKPAAKTNSSAATTVQTKTTSPTSTNTSLAQGLQLDTSKNYGDKYSNGILPVGDGEYTASGPKQGYIYACGGYAQNLATQNGGAMTRGPWFTDNNTEYNVNEKLHVQGSVMWQADFTDTVSGDTRTIVTNDLPSHPTGIFPIMSTDPAYQYDRNPNSIKGQTFTFNLSANPTYNVTPNCEGGEVGVMLTGVVLFSGLDAGGRDAGAWEVQDSCDGHPQTDGIYHYHTLSTCIKDTSVKTIIGYGLDGFPITGPYISPTNVLTTSDLDECHGIVSQINLNGKNITTYHYVMTQDYPYSISCFRGTPIAVH